MIFREHSPRRLALRLALVVGGLLALSSAQALTFCASSVATLNTALSLGTLQNQAYTIQIVQGTYLMNADMNYVFSAPTTIEGGYTANCVARVVDAANTVINIGQNHGFYLQQYEASPEAQINVDGITFANSNSVVGFSVGEFVQLAANHAGSINLSRVRFTQIQQASNIWAVLLEAYDGSINLDNVLFDHITTPFGCAVALLSQNHASVNINHMTADLNSGNGFCWTDFDDDAQMSVQNSILWSSDGGQSMFRGIPGYVLSANSQASFINDLFRGQSLGVNTFIVNQINANPIWIAPASGDYTLAHNQTTSPAINSGTVIVPGGEPATDIAGDPRLVGTAPDRGAYESNYNNFSVLTVTNTQDSGAGSLRQAMLDANSSPSIAKSIKFDIRGAGNVPVCPAVIALNSVLPELSASMSIDGYSQSLSTKNTDASAFNANLCILLKPAAGSLSTAFRVPAAAPFNPSLVLHGLGIGGFGQPIQLLGGSNHLISGNQFGGVANAVTLPGAGLSAITFGVNAGGSLIVGGQNLADRNVIGGASINGISIQAGIASSIANCQIVNNLIGLAPNAQSQLANNVGINVNGSGCAITRNRIAGNTTANIWLNGGNANVVQQNQIGITPQNIGFLNSAVGILVTGSNNIIGASGNGGAITANTVRAMFAGGVVIKGDNVSGNSVNANLVYENGQSGNGMDIDLQPSSGVSGPNPNDPGDGDSGANLQQNFPVPTQLVYTGPGSLPGNLNRPALLSAVLDTQPGVYRVDAYFSSAINSSGQRGHAEVFIGRTTINVGNAATVFSLPVSVPNQLAGGVVSLTATDVAGNTSEIGTALLAVDPLLFKNGFE